MSPIVVHASPLVPQLMAGARQGAAVVGPIVSVVALKHGTGPLQLALIVAGGLVGIAAVWMGQVHTRHDAQKLAILAMKLPDDIAKTK